jgi:hypothetical protein
MAGVLGRATHPLVRSRQLKGYADGAQVELSVGQDCTATFQWIAIASKLQAARVK